MTKKAYLAPTLSLFASTSTLLCCALPALLVTIGAGAVMAGLASNVPGYIWLTEHKVGLFLASGFMLALAAIMRWRSRNAPCPIDPDQAQACQRIRRVSGIILYGSVVILLIGGFFAFFAADLLL
jgi:cytochrome b561